MKNGGKPSRRILVADDEEAIRITATQLLTYEGFTVIPFDPARSDESLLRQTWDVAILDMVMPGIDGFELRRRIAASSPHAQFIIITGHPDHAMLARAMDLGIFTFLTKPFTAEQLRYAVLGALRLSDLFTRHLDQGARLASDDMGLVGRDPTIAVVRRMILEFAPTPLPMLITGETGTGKEIVARCIHRYSPRTQAPFVAFSCAALSPNLVASELFGHAKGAFTGATQARDGYFGAARGGTLFLDEIGEMPIEIQSALLRVLDTGEYTPVGETRARTADVRIVSATNRDLEALVRSGTFREDLIYRLRGAHIALPPLRRRRDDIPLLLDHFLDTSRLALSPDSRSWLASLDWAGNVRELAMVATRIQALASGRIVTIEAARVAAGIMPERVTEGVPLPPYHSYKERLLADADRGYMRLLMEATGGNISKAARIAGLDRKSIYAKLKETGVTPTSTPPPADCG